MTGFTGSRGFVGSRGTAGAIGASGYTGSRGAAGNTGGVGYTGSLGLTGLQGAAGPRGTTGTTGLTGFTGSQGTIGPRGTTGTTGLTGFIGSQGIQGPAGTFSTGSNVIVSSVTTNNLTVNSSTNLNGLLKLVTVTSSTIGTFSASNGALVYNSSVNKFQGYANGSWSDLSGGGGSFNGNTISTQFRFTDTTQSASTGSGAVIISGGLGVGKNVYASGFVTTAATTPEVYSASNLNLTAVGRVQVTQSPLKVWVTTSTTGISAVNGDIIYNSSTHKFQGYANGVWVNLH